MDSLQRLREIRALKGNLHSLENAECIITHLREITDVSAGAKAGFSLRGVSEAQWNEGARDFVKPIRLGIVSNFVCTEVENSLRFNFLRERIYPEMYSGDFDQYIFELMGEESDLHQFEPDLTLCLLDEHVITERLGDEWFIDEMEEKLQEMSNTLCELFSRYAQNAKGVLVLNTIALSSLTYYAFIDHRSKARLSRAWRGLNMQLLDLALEYKNIVLVDVEVLLQKPGVRLREARMAAYAKMYMDESLLAQIAVEVRKIAQSIVGKTKKCLVLDCDNTLWGGVIGEDGLEGIALGGSPEGEAYVTFHKAIKRLGKQGIILALNSKNDKANTDKVFDSHPDTQLRQDDFVMQCVNWNPKHENLKELAARINIGTDHMVFVDDSDFECNLVKGMMPQVNVVQLSAEAPEHVEALLEGGWFDALELTSEDYQRATQYKSEVAREACRAVYDSYEAYLRELDISVELFIPDALSMARIAQLTQRTNQFNLTTWRLSEQETQRLIEDKDWLIIGIRSADRFGDNGIVGAMFVQRLSEVNGGLVFAVKNILLSCRVFSRGIETSALHAVLAWAREEGAQKVFGEYIPSPKNGKFKNFFESNGFEALEQHAGGPVTYFHALQEIAAPVGWIDVKSKFLEVGCVYV